MEVVETDPGQAIKNCTAILNADQLTTAERAEALKIRGRAHYRTDRLGDAIRDYEAALTIAPDDPELHLRRGWTAFDERDLETVFAHAHRALELKPGYADVYGLIGTALTLGGPQTFAEAKAAFDEAVRLQPQDLLPRYNRLFLLRANNFNDEAMKEAEAILALPTSVITKPAAVGYLGRRTTYRIAVTMERASLLRILGRFDEARQTYDRAIELDPDPLTYARRAEFRHSQVGFIPGAPAPPLTDVQDDLDKALALDPDYWLSRNEQAKLHLNRHEYELAAADFARALKGNPIYGQMRWRYAETLRELGRNDEAASEAITAFRLDPDFMSEKIGLLQKRGYLAALTPNADPRPAVIDAVRACMLDERCQ